MSEYKTPAEEASRVARARGSHRTVRLPEADDRALEDRARAYDPDRPNISAEIRRAVRFYLENAPDA